MSSIIFISHFHTGVKLVSLSVHKTEVILIEDCHERCAATGWVSIVPLL